MKRRKFLRGLLGTGAAVVAAPVIAKVGVKKDWPWPNVESESKAITTDSYHLTDDAENQMKVSGNPLSTGSIAKAFIPVVENFYGKEYYADNAQHLNEILTKK